eukprot:403348656
MSTMSQERQAQKSILNSLQNSSQTDLLLTENRKKLQKILKVTSNTNQQQLFFQKRNVSSLTQANATAHTPAHNQSRQIPLNQSPIARDLKSSLNENRRRGNQLSFDSNMNVLQNQSKFKNSKYSIHSGSLINLKSTLMPLHTEPNAVQSQDKLQILIQDDQSPYDHLVLQKKRIDANKQDSQNQSINLQNNSQSQNQVYKDTIHSQDKLASECSKVIKWIQAILEEAQIYRIPKSLQKKINNLNGGDSGQEENNDGLAARMRQNNAFDVNQEEITEQALKNIFKDFHLKNKIEKLKQTLQESQQLTRRSHASHVMRNNEFVNEEKVKKQSNSPNKAGLLNSPKKSMMMGKKQQIQTQVKKQDKETYEKINLKLNQEKILLQEMPTSDFFTDLCQDLRVSIDQLLILGMSPFDQSSYTFLDFQPDKYYTALINNSSDEWIQFVRERVGVERLSKFNPFIKQEHQVFNNFEVQKLYNYIQLAKDSNIKKKELTKLIINLRRVENRYETSFQLLNKQNDLLIKICNQLNVHVEKLTQFNINQHQFYEKTLFEQIYQPFLDLRKLEEKIENSEKERKDLLNFYIKFQNVRDQAQGQVKQQYFGVS